LQSSSMRLSVDTSFNSLTPLALIIALAVLPSGTGQAGQGSPYESLFRDYGSKYLPEHHWTLFSAQAKAESLYEPYAKSRAGAMGVMQLMPKTFDEQSQRLRADCSPWSPRCSLQLGIHYDMRMFRQFKRQDPMESARFGLASYNAGLGTVLMHQRDCGGSRIYAEVEPCLWDEPRHYVRRIERFQKDLQKK